MKKALKYTTIASVAAVIAMMIAATITEKLESTQFAFDHFYHSPLFMVLWAAAGICSLLYFIADKGKKAPFTLGLHIAACVILLGALLTFLGGKTGTLKLRAGEGAAEYLDDDGNPQPLPFSVTLQKFTIERYPGSMAPSDFRSDILVESGGKTEERVISMNNIAKIDGYRLYQADYDEDLQGSILAVSHDPWGVGVTYTGYILLLS